MSRPYCNQLWVIQSVNPINHSPILRLAGCVKFSDVERGDSSAAALIRLQRLSHFC